MDARKIILELPACGETLCRTCKFQHRGPPRHAVLMKIVSEEESDFHWGCDLFTESLKGGKELIRCQKCLDAERRLKVLEQYAIRSESGIKRALTEGVLRDIEREQDEAALGTESTNRTMESGEQPSEDGGLA